MAKNLEISMFTVNNIIKRKIFTLGYCKAILDGHNLQASRRHCIKNRLDSGLISLHGQHNTSKNNYLWTQFIIASTNTSWNSTMKINRKIYLKPKCKTTHVKCKVHFETKYNQEDSELLCNWSSTSSEIRKMCHFQSCNSSPQFQNIYKVLLKEEVMWQSGCRRNTTLSQRFWHV